MRSTLSLKFFILLVLVVVGISYTRFAADCGIVPWGQKKTRFEVCRIPSVKKFYEPRSCDTCCQKKGPASIDTEASQKYGNCVCTDSPNFKVYGDFYDREFDPSTYDRQYSYGRPDYEESLKPARYSSRPVDHSRSLHPGDYSGHPAHYESGYPPVGYPDEETPYYSQAVPATYGHGIHPQQVQPVYSRPSGGSSSAASAAASGGSASAAASATSSRRPTVQQVPQVLPHMSNPAIFPVHQGNEYGAYPPHRISGYPSVPHVPLYSQPRLHSRRGDFSDSDSDSDSEFRPRSHFKK